VDREVWNAVRVQRSKQQSLLLESRLAVLVASSDAVPHERLVVRDAVEIATAAQNQVVIDVALENVVGFYSLNGTHFINDGLSLAVAPSQTVTSRFM
jgi:hypothetical protein